jgi:hypothetical protein
LVNARIRPTATRLALVAMLLRALVPAGWMPGTANGSPLVLCTANGLVQVLDASLAPMPDDAPASHSPAADGNCPFGAAASPVLPATPRPELRIEYVPATVARAAQPAYRLTSPTGSHTARAPPLPSIA